MVGITNSNGIGKIYAVIGVTYPSGSTCTCTNGAKTLTAKDTTGRARFVIPSAGTWTAGRKHNYNSFKGGKVWRTKPIIKRT